MYENKSKEFFEDELKTILFIHFDAKYYFKDVEYLNNPETLDELRVSKSLFIRKLKIAFWRLGIIEISKLFLKSKNQHFNLIDYLDNLNNNYKNYDWVKELPKSQINNWLNKFNSHEILSIRKRIEIQRNKYFAHTDRNPKYELKNSTITFKEINKLIEFTEEIITKLKQHCLQTHIDLEIVGMEKSGNILEMVSFYDMNKEHEIIERNKNYIKERNKNGA